MLKLNTDRDRYDTSTRAPPLFRSRLSLRYNMFNWHSVVLFTRGAETKREREDCGNSLLTFFFVYNTMKFWNDNDSVIVCSEFGYLVQNEPQLSVKAKIMMKPQQDHPFIFRFYLWKHVTVTLYVYYFPVLFISCVVSEQCKINKYNCKELEWPNLARFLLLCSKTIFKYQSNFD